MLVELSRRSCRWLSMVTSLADSSDKRGLGSSPAGPPPLRFSRMEPAGKERGQQPGPGRGCSAGFDPAQPVAAGALYRAWHTAGPQPTTSR